MTRDEIRQCKGHVDEALGIMERLADTQPEVHVLIALRELMQDIVWLETCDAPLENVVRLSDVRHLRALGCGGSDF
jgi:hypothetical protein